MARIDIDENRWPIVIITLSGKESRTDLEELVDKLDGYQSRDEDFCFVMDLREMKKLSQDARNLLISWLKETDMHQLAGRAVVVSSSLMRLYLSTIIFMAWSLDPRKRSFKHKTVCSLNQAYEWSRGRLHPPRGGKGGGGQ